MCPINLFRNNQMCGVVLLRTRQLLVIKEIPSIFMKNREFINLFTAEVL